MRLATLAPDALAVVTEGGLVPIGAVLARDGSLPATAAMVDLMPRFDQLRPGIEEAIVATSAHSLGSFRLRAPVPTPSKIWAAATNYLRGSTTLGDAKGRGTDAPLARDEILEMSFLKPPSAVIGPGEAIVIPKGAETVFPELELCVVIGREARDLPREQALEAVFGYTIILDVTARGYGTGKGLEKSRCVRKGFDTFAPIGPWITTKDEIPDPQNLGMSLRVNGELRQSARTNAMINSVADLVSYLSGVCTLQPGDLIATGNPDAPEFQEPLAPGDSLEAEIEGIGVLNLSVKKAG